MAAAYEWLFVPPGQRPPHWDEANAVRADHMAVPAALLAAVGWELPPALAPPTAAIRR